MTIFLDWTAAADQGRLYLEYTFHNRGPSTVWLLDRLLLPTGRAAAFALSAAVLPGGRRHARILLGHAEPLHPVSVVLAPAARAVAPGASHAGSLSVPLPLRGWQPNGQAAPIDPIVASLTLEVGVLRELDRWCTYPLEDGGTIRAPLRAAVVAAQEVVSGRRLPMPAPTSWRRTQDLFAHLA